MTEPPDAPPPDEGGGADDPGQLSPEEIQRLIDSSSMGTRGADQIADRATNEAVEEVLRRVRELDEQEQLDVLGDDALLDHLGRGGDDSGELADMLSAWRDDVESVPPPPGTDPETIQQIHDFTQEIDRATQPPRPPEGVPAPMTAMDDAAALSQAGTENYEAILGAINRIEEALNAAIEVAQGVTMAGDAAVGVASGVLGEGHGALGGIQTANAQLTTAVGECMQVINAARDLNAMQGAAQQLSEAFSAAAQQVGGQGG